MAGLFGIPYEGDPTGALLGQNYNAQTEQEQKIWGLLDAAGQAFMHPKQGSGDLGVIGDAASAAGTGMQKAGTDYLATALSRQQTQQKLLEQQRLEQERISMEKAAVNFMGAQAPELQKAILNNPQMAAQYWEAFLKQYGASTSGSGSRNSRGAGQPIFVPDKDGNLVPSWGQPSLDPNGEFTITPLPKGTQVGTSAELRGDQAGAVAKAKANEEKLAMLPTSMNQSENIIAGIDDIMSRPDMQQYLGMNSVWKNLPGTATAGVMADLNKLAGGFRVQALPLWRGSGPVTEAEGKASVDAAFAAEQSQNPADFFYHMADAKWHATAAYRIAKAQYDAQDTFKYYSVDDVMKDTPRPKRSDFTGKGITPPDGSPAPTTVEEVKKMFPELFEGGQ